MRVKTVSVMAVALASAVMALSVPGLLGQRRNGTNGTNGTFVVAPQRTAPSASPQVIMPMGNPVPPMIPPTPFIRYSDGPPTVVYPGQPSGNHGGNNGRGNHGGQGQPGNGLGGRYAPVVPNYYYPPYYNYYQPYYSYYSGIDPVPVIPGQLPGSIYYQDYYHQGQESSSPVTDLAPPPQAASTVYTPQTEYYSEPHLIINEPRPNHVIVPPAIGTSRADVIAQFGQPWGTVKSRGQETLYFDGLVVVFDIDGRVMQVR